MPRPHLAVGGILAGLVLLPACQTQILDNTPPSAVAYVAPGTLNLRPTLTQKDGVVAVLHHGERVQVIESRRRFVKIRSARGATGWVDALQLLTPEGMAQIQADAQRAASLPSEGAATAFEELNVHLEPNRQSPAFARILEGSAVEVLGHKIAPRTTSAPKAPVFTIPKPVSARKQRKQSESKDAFPFPHPKPPAPPQSELLRPAPEPQSAASVSQTPAVLEDWSLIRMKDKQTGWVLSRNLMMSIPDEVAQYAEGKHITSFFDLGSVSDEEKGTKHNWLWTTTSEMEPFDFDGWRVFIWNRRRHRYETSHRARDLEGYFPVIVDPAEPGSSERTFHLTFKEDDGKLWVHNYTFDGMLVHAPSKIPYDAQSAGAAAAAQGSKSAQSANSPGWLSSHWRALMQKFKKK
jgi:hypothetical protein